MLKPGKRYFLSIFAVLFIGMSIDRTAGAQEVTPAGELVNKMVLPGVEYLKSHYNKKGGYGDVSLVGMALYNSGLRLGKNQAELRSDPVIQEILQRVSTQVLKKRSANNPSVISLSMTGILLTEVNAFKYRKQLDHILNLITALQLPNGAWGSKVRRGEVIPTQYACLFLWIAKSRRLNVKAETFEKAYDFLIESQHESGGFTSNFKSAKDVNQVTQVSSAAGLAGIYMIGDAFQLGPHSREIANARAQNVDSFANARSLGQKWFGKELQPNSEEQPFNFLNNYERYMTFKEHVEWIDSESPKWYVDGFNYLKSNQQKDGSWVGTHSSEQNKDRATSLALLFLIRSTDLLVPRYVDVTELGSTHLPDKGPIGPNRDEPGAAEKLVVRYTVSSKKHYAEVLDYFKIELASVSKTSQDIQYATNVSAAKPGYRKGLRKDEKRVFFAKNENHRAMAWDKAILEAAGAETEGRYIRSFLPKSTFDTLYQQLKQTLKRDGKQLGDVKQAMFTFEPKRLGGYEIRLNGIRYR